MAATEPVYGLDFTGQQWRGLPSLWLRCPFALRTQAKALPGAQWDADNKVWRWVLTQENQAALVAAVLSAFPAAQRDAATMRFERRALPPPGPSLREVLEADLPRLPVKSLGQRTAYPHQLLVPAALYRRQRFLVLDEMGTGKTSSAIEAFLQEQAHGHVERLVVICPTGVRAVWVDELAAVCGTDRSDIAIVEPNPPQFTGRRVRGLTDQAYRLHQLERRAVATIINLESVANSLEDLQPLVRGQFLVIDEAHRLKNPSSKVFQAVCALAPQVLILQTGTPVANAPEDLWTLIHLVEPALVGSYSRFLAEYTKAIPITPRTPGQPDVKQEVGHAPTPATIARVGDGHAPRVFVPMTTGYLRLDDLRTRLASVSLRRTKEECLNLPPKVRSRRVLPMTAAQARAYESMRLLLVAEFEGQADEWFRVHAASIEGALMKLQQIADGFAFTDTSSVWFPEVPKLDEAREIAAEVKANERQAVFWSRFVAPVERLAHELGVRPYHGKAAQGERDDIQARFMAGTDSFFVGQIHTGGLGLNLQCADTVVFYDQWWAPYIMRQAEDRCHRSGQTRPVNIITLLAEDTIDEGVTKVLTRKERQVSQLLHEPTSERATALTRAEVHDMISHLGAHDAPTRKAPGRQ